MATQVKRLAALAVIIISVGVFSTTLVHALWYAPEDEISYVNENPIKAFVPAAHATSSTVGPERLIIPSLGIDANVQEVGINAKGNMGVPSNFSDVAWYKYGTTPGDMGSAVIDGHVDNGLGLAGVFKHLGDMQIGDDVYVENKDGERLHFVVTDIQSYPYKDAPDEQIFNAGDAARLNLITCEGKWVKADKTYDQRLVIYTKLVSDS